MSMPASTCFWTISATAVRARAANAARRPARPVRALDHRQQVGRRGQKLPVWVVRIRSVLRFLDNFRRWRLIEDDPVPAADRLGPTPFTPCTAGPPAADSASA